MVLTTSRLRSSGRLALTSLAAAAIVLALTPAASQGAEKARRYWKPIADDVYLQEVGGRIVTDKPVTSVAVCKDIVYVVVDGSVKVVKGRALEDVAGAPKGVHRMVSLNDELWVAADAGAYHNFGTVWERVDARSFVDFCLHLGKVYGATQDAIYRLEGSVDSSRFVDIKPAGGYLSNDSTVTMEDFTQVLADPVLLGPIAHIASYSGTLYWLRPDGITLLDGKTVVPGPIDWGTMPSNTTRDLLSMGTNLFVATDRGVADLRGMSLTALRAADGLPNEDTTCLAEGFDGDLWIGTTHGAIRKSGDAYTNYAGRTWLPGDSVSGIAVSGKTVYVATNAGLGIIRYEPYTLAKKAAVFEREMNEWGFKRLGFINGIYWSGEKDGWIHGVSDNDGGNTAHYLAAMTYKYAVTGDETARTEAVETFNAMAWLEDITGVPGFIARAIWSVQGDKGHRDDRGSGGLPAKWYTTADGLWMWKGDTSSDEVDGHMYAVSLFHDLAAKGREKERAANHIARTATHIIDNGWVFRDKDGKPTRWGRWDPDYLLKPYGYDSRGLNGMEAQAFMFTAFGMTGDQKYMKALDQLIKWRYHTYTVRQKLTFPPDVIAPWDDELAFRSYLPMLTYAKDPDLRSIYLRSITRSWELLRPQHDPWFNFIYGAVTGNDCEVPQATATLRAQPVDLIRYDDRSEPRGVEVPHQWLEAYWMGRYYGMIEAPKTTDHDALTPGPSTPKPHGGAHFGGPARPPAP